MDQLCVNVVKSYLLYQNPLYAFSFPISLIAAIVVYGICVYMKCSSNSYMLQLVIPILTIIVVNMLISLIAEMMINKSELNQLNALCVSMIQEGFEGKKELNMDEKKMEEVKSVNVPEKKSEDIHSLLPIVDNLYNSTFEVINPDSTPFMLPYEKAESMCNIR